MPKNDDIKGLSFLKVNHAGIMMLKDGTTINYGVIRFEDEKVIFYTGKGLREIWAPDLSQGDKEKAEKLKNLSEAELIQSEHIKVIPIDNIERVVF